MREGVAWVSALVLVGGLGIVACGGSEPEPENPATLAPTATYPASTMPAATAPAGTYPAATAPAASSAPNPIAPIEPALQQTALTVLNEMATREAPGAKPVGETRVALLGTAQTMEQTVSMKPGKCYTVVAAGLLPVNELNVQLLPATVVPGTNMVLAQDQTTGPQAIVGQTPNCFKWALPVEGQVRVVTTVAVGAGLVATQVYEK